MITKKLIDKINEAVKIEGENGKEIYGETFKNWFEVYGALACEVEEAKCEQRGMEEVTGRYLFEMRHHELYNLDAQLANIRAYALNLAYEAIQVACICDKGIESNLEV